MATLRRTDSKPLKPTTPPPPPRECVVCCEFDTDALIKPCRECDTDYCAGCLNSMFVDATTDRTRMPPRCCSLLQIHTGVSDMSPEEGRRYREKFEEWLAPTKLYCPAPTCSAFIPERLVPKSPSPTEEGTSSSLQVFLRDILSPVTSSPSARFFRGEMDITLLPGYSAVVERPIDLSKISNNLSRYDSVSSLTLDMQLLVGNAVTYNGSSHPVSKAAEEVHRLYVQSLSANAQRLLDGPPRTASSTATFACHKCHIAICTNCKQIEHGKAPCDLTFADQELAMLESFGYKRCPRCQAGVKKMYGCSHMACICGAHWCYWCRRSIDECDGACAERDEEDDEDEGEYDSEEDGGGEEAERGGNDAPLQQRAIPVTTPAPATAENPAMPENLDAGGYRRWAEHPELDFGEEPEEDPHLQTWSCKHLFSKYAIEHEDTFDRGDYLKMECNRCFAHVVPHKPAMSSRKLRSRIADSCPRSSFGKWLRSLEKGDEPKGETAWECARCRVVTCDDCHKKYEDALRAGRG